MTVALVHVPLLACPACGAGLDTELADQLPLLRHGGYGAAKITRWLLCAARCGWDLVAEVSEHRAG